MNIFGAQILHPGIALIFFEYFYNLFHNHLDQCVGKYTKYAYKMNQPVMKYLRRDILGITVLFPAFFRVANKFNHL
jgi:hypothetical protein